MEEKNKKTKYNWIELKREFFADKDFIEAHSFIKWKLGVDKADGNMELHIRGWTNEKKEYQRKILEQAQEELSKEEIKKLTIKLKDVMAGKKLGFNLLNRYLDCFRKQLRGDELSDNELKFLKDFPINIDGILKWLQLELNLPTNIAQIQGDKNNPLGLKAELSKEDRELLHRVLELDYGKHPTSKREDNPGQGIQEGVSEK